MAPAADRILAFSCTCVGVGPGGTTNLLARVGIVDYRGHTVFDKFVKPTTEVTDYRTATTGITEEDLNSPDAWTFHMVQNFVKDLFQDRIIVGHGIWNHLAVLGLPHRAVDTRDLALYQPYRNGLGHPNQIIGLRTLVWQYMGRHIQEGQIHPLEDARGIIDTYRSSASDWERSIDAGNWPCILPPSTFSRCYI